MRKAFAVVGPMAVLVGCGGELPQGLDTETVTQAAVLQPSPRTMPTSVAETRGLPRQQRARALAEWWYRDYALHAGSSFGTASADGGLRSFRRMTGLLLHADDTQDPAQIQAAAQAVESWTSTMTDDGDHAGTDCVGKNGDWDMVMSEIISFIYMFKDRPDLVTDNAIYNLITRGIGSYVGAVATKMVWPCFGTSYPETENHVLMIESSRYLANQWLRYNPRYDQRLADQYPTLAGQEVNAGSQIEDVLLKALARVVWGDFFESNARTYQGLAAHAILNLYEYAADDRMRAAAKNALDFASTKFAFQSFQGKRLGPTRRNHGYANTLSLYENDSFVLFMAGLSGGYVWQDDLDAPDNFYNGTWSGVSGANLTQGAGLAMWAAHASYALPEAPHDFLLNKHDGYWARMHPRHYDHEYEEHNWAHYFTGPTSRDIVGGLVFAPETYFATPRFLNAGGGFYSSYPLTALTENSVELYDTLTRPITLLTPGHYGAWPDEVIPDDGILTFCQTRNLNNFNATLLSMMGNSLFWKSSNYGVYKSFAYGYYWNTECGATKSEHLMWPMDVPGSWAALQYKESTTNTWSKGRATFRFYDLTADLGFYVVMARVSKSQNTSKYRDYARGFWEVVPKERFATIKDLKTWVVSDSNNPASNFQDTTSGDAKWFKYKMTTKETVWLDLLVGYDDGYHMDPIIKVIDAAGRTQLPKNKVFSRNDNASPPLLDVKGVDKNYNDTDTYARALADGKVTVNNPFTVANLSIDSANYTAPKRAESARSLDEALDIPAVGTTVKTVVRTATGFTRRTSPGTWFDHDYAASEPLHDNQSASFEISATGAGIVFDWGVSCEAGYDKLILYVDNVEKLSITGEVIQKDLTVPLPSGTHTYRFEYRKDYSVSAGDDRGWVDHLRFL